MKQSVLPLWRRAIFVDWHGVLSRDPFWTSILGNDRHPLRPRLTAGLAEILDHDQPTSHDWMKGIHSSDDIISAMDIELPRGFNKDFLRRRLTDDCRRMRVNVELFELLKSCRKSAFVIVATDNMDCFVNAFEHVRTRSRRFSDSPETLADWARTCDDIICSSDVGALKSEDPLGFFGPCLTTYGLTFADAVLIDDRADNCEAFCAHGGQAIRWKMHSDGIQELEESLASWLPGEHLRRAV